ncbi:MAG: 4-hydroxy-tetrahydrodipicolinate synthase [Deltaproteobacteria bacterium]|nr:4-hydroxy-tetrahydrodipicolinate synthase [Deltaproteobacteria bacterium]
MLSGTITALVTPMRDEKVDLDALKRLVRRQLDAGVDGLVPCGTTGEAATLSRTEYDSVIETVVTEVAGAVPVIAGTGTNSTNRVIETTKRTAALGATAALVVTPYYNKPTQEGLYQHYKKVADESGLPIVLYNVPGRTGCNLLPQTVARLADLPGIIAVKEASGSLDQLYDVVTGCGDKLDVLTGDDALAFPSICAGARGVVSVTSNVVPDRMSQMVQATLDGNMIKAREFHYQLLDLFRAMFFETNPIPVKTAMGLMGLMDPEIRLPLWMMSPQAKGRLEQVLRFNRLIP